MGFVFAADRSNLVQWIGHARELGQFTQVDVESELDRAARASTFTNQGGRATANALTYRVALCAVVSPSGAVPAPAADDPQSVLVLRYSFGCPTDGNGSPHAASDDSAPCMIWSDEDRIVPRPEPPPTWTTLEQPGIAHGDLATYTRVIGEKCGQ